MKTFNKVWFPGSLCYTIVGTSTAWPSPTLTKMTAGEAPIILDDNQISWMVSLMFLGHISSPIPTGFLMEMFGRKKTCLYLSILPVSSWLLIIFATSATDLYIARFTAGLWIGVISVIIPVYVGEISSTDIRSSLTTINNSLFNFGIIFVYIIGPYVDYFLLAVSCLALTVLFVLSFIFMPESPYHLIKHNQRDDAIKSLSWLRKGASSESILNEIKVIELLQEEVNHQKGTLKDIFFDRGNRKAFIISITFSIAKRLSGSGVLQAYTSITLPPLTMHVLDPDSCVIIIGVVSFLSSVVSTSISALCRRNVLLTVSCGGCSLATAVIGVWFYLAEFSPYKSAVRNSSDVIFWSLVMYYIAFNIALGPIGTSIKGEVFSGNVKALSSSLNTFIVAFSAFLVNKFYLIVANSIGMYFNYVVYSITCALVVVFTWFYVPEMHNKTFEEIITLMKGKKCNGCKGLETQA